MATSRHKSPKKVKLSTQDQLIQISQKLFVIGRPAQGILQAVKEGNALISKIDQIFVSISQGSSAHESTLNTMEKQAHQLKIQFKSKNADELIKLAIHYAKRKESSHLSVCQCTDNRLNKEKIVR